jgi:hypothetical protein
LEIDLPPEHEPAEDQNGKHRNQYERDEVPLEFHAFSSDDEKPRPSGSVREQE